MSIASKPSEAIFWQAFSIGNSVKWIEEVDSRICHGDLFAGRSTPSADIPLTACDAATAPITLRNSRRPIVWFIGRLFCLPLTRC